MVGLVGGGGNTRRMQEQAGQKNIKRTTLPKYLSEISGCCFHCHKHEEELQQVRKKHEEELKQLRDKYDDELDSIRKELSQLGQELGRFESPRKKSKIDADVSKKSSKGWRRLGPFKSNSHKKQEKDKGLNQLAIKDVTPRGLANTGNLCFVNATMQALLSCSAFVYHLRKLCTYSISEAEYPTLRAICDFIPHFEADASSKAFTPSMLKHPVVEFSPPVPQIQEDAGEFLAFLMDKTDTEFRKWVTLCGNDGKKSFFSWRKGKNSTDAPFASLRITEMFEGQEIIITKVPGEIDTFLLLHLSILTENDSIEKALVRRFSASELILSAEVEKTATEMRKISVPPKILVLLLLRFHFDVKTGISSKLDKHVRFGLDVVIDRDLLVDTYPLDECLSCKLIATITHLGESCSTGHYYADRYCSDKQW